MINYTWNFETFDVLTNDTRNSNLKDVVIAINWVLTAEASDELGSRSVSLSGTAGLSEPDQENFIPFNMLTKDWAISEVIKYNNEDELKQSLADRLSDTRPAVQSVIPIFNSNTIETI